MPATTVGGGHVGPVEAHDPGHPEGHPVTRSDDLETSVGVAHLTVVEVLVGQLGGRHAVLGLHAVLDSGRCRPGAGWRSARRPPRPRWRPTGSGRPCRAVIFCPAVRAAKSAWVWVSDLRVTWLPMSVPRAARLSSRTARERPERRPRRPRRATCLRDMRVLHVVLELAVTVRVTAPPSGIGRNPMILASAVTVTWTWVVPSRHRELVGLLVTVGCVVVCGRHLVLTYVSRAVPVQQSPTSRRRATELAAHGWSSTRRRSTSRTASVPNSRDEHEAAPGRTPPPPRPLVAASPQPAHPVSARLSSAPPVRGHRGPHCAWPRLGRSGSTADPNR